MEIDGSNVSLAKPRFWSILVIFSLPTPVTIGQLGPHDGTDLGRGLQTMGFEENPGGLVGGPWKTQIGQVLGFQVG
jgi:hypothetical protein